MKSAHLRARDKLDELDELHRAQPRWGWQRDNWRAQVRRVIAECQTLMLEADRDVADAHDTRKGPRSCSWCRGPIPTDARSDATTCSKKCRQAKHRGGSARKPLWPKGTRTSSTPRLPPVDLVGILGDAHDSELVRASQLELECTRRRQLDLELAADEACDAAMAEIGWFPVAELPPSSRTATPATAGLEVDSATPATPRVVAAPPIGICRHCQVDAHFYVEQHATPTGYVWEGDPCCRERLARALSSTAEPSIAELAPSSRPGFAWAVPSSSMPAHRPDHSTVDG